MKRMHWRRPFDGPSFVVIVALASAAVGIAPASLRAAELDGAALLAATERYHDPRGVWPAVCLELELRETRPQGEDRKTHLVLDIEGGRFELAQRTGEGPESRGILDATSCRWTVDGSAEIPPEVRQERRLTCERLEWLRNYYSYLWSLPMKLSDPGTRIAPQVVRGAFDNRPADVLRVTYDPEVGGDVWLFYVDPESGALLGARFYHDEAAGDGEVILMVHGVVEPETGLVLPKERAWYTNRDGEYLGTDILESVRTCR